LIIAIVLFSAVITLGTTAVQLYLDYDHDVTMINDRLTQIEESHLESIVASVWFLDSKQVALQLDGLLRMPAMESASIVIEGKTRWEAGQRSEKRGIRKEFVLVHKSLGKQEVIGTLKVQASLEEVYNRLYEKTLVILASNGFKTFLVAGFIFFLVNNFITRHIDRLVRYTESLDLNNTAPPLVLDRATYGEKDTDELDQLVRAINTMRKNLAQSFDALKESGSYNRMLFENAPVGQALMTPDRILIDVNPAYARILGYSAEEILGRCTVDFTPENYAEDDRIQTQKLETEGRLGPYEKEYVNKDGDLVPVRMAGLMIRQNDQDLVWVVAEDISHQKKAAEELRRSEERFRDFAESTSDWFWEMDAELRFQQFSTRYQEITGVDPNLVIGKRRDQMPNLRAVNDDWQQHMDDLEARRSFKDVAFEVTRPDGSVFYSRISGKPVFDKNGTFTGYRGTGTDITDIILAEAEKERLEQQLRQSQRLETVGTLAGGIAHDFNNLLMPILGYTDIMLKQLPSEDPMYGKLERIGTAADRAKALVQQILTFSRRGEQSKKPVQLQPIIEETLKLIRATVPASIQIESELDSSCGPVLADATQMHQMLMNLYTNASQAMAKDEGKMRVELKPSESPPPGLTGPALQLTVTDTGPGMDAETLERIFDPFFSTKKKAGGTGLGLATVHGIVASHGGLIETESSPGQGATFSIFFTTVDQPSPGDGRKAESRDTRSKKNLHILFVDDEPENATLAEAMLGELGYRVTTFTDSVGALAYFENNAGDIDLVITDQSMPNLTGERLSKGLLKLEPDLPIIMITGFSSKMNDESAQAVGIKGFMMKPISLLRLDKAIREVLA